MLTEQMSNLPGKPGAFGQSTIVSLPQQRVPLTAKDEIEPKALRDKIHCFFS